MAAADESLCEAVICIVRSDVQVSTVISEVESVMSRPAPPICVLLGPQEDVAITDFKKELATSFPSAMSREHIPLVNASMPVQGTFSIKEILDTRRISNFVVISAKEDLELLLVAMDCAFTTAYSAKVKVYGGPYIHIASELSGISADVKLSVKRECVQYLSELRVNPLETVEIVTSKLISEDVFVHGFSTRKGGCSLYPSVSSLNLAYIPSKKDPLITVQENRRRLLNFVGASSHEFKLAKAVHGATVWVVGSPEPQGYDAIVCDKPGIVVAAPAADCVTAILADPNRSVCAAVHSGWKGTLANVIGATVETLTGKFGCNLQDIRAAIGPSIGVCCYEVGLDVEGLFSDHKLLCGCVQAVEGKEKKHLHLQLAVRLQLEEAGVSRDHIDDSPGKLCTLCNEDKFFSYRRDGRPFGTHVGFIGLRVPQ